MSLRYDSAVGGGEHSDGENQATLMCPSAQPGMENAIVLGVVLGTTDRPQLSFLKDALPATDSVLRLSQEVNPTEVFRFAATCATSACTHFDGKDCLLARRIVSLADASVERIPNCSIRSSCRWWMQEGKAACVRCPGIVTEVHTVTDDISRIAGVVSTGCSGERAG